MGKKAEEEEVLHKYYEEYQVNYLPTLSNPVQHHQLHLKRQH